MKFFATIAIIGTLAATTSLASHKISDSGKSGQRILVTDMFWGGSDCKGVDMTFELVSPPSNGTVTQRKVREKLNSAKINLSPPHRCEGNVMPISYVSYQSKKGFKGTDKFTVRWTSATGETRERTYSVTID